MKSLIQWVADDPLNYVVLSAAHLGRRRWREALAAADEALEIDPEHTGAANLRASALVHLGRRDEAAWALALDSRKWPRLTSVRIAAASMK